MKTGKVVETGLTAHVFANPAHPYTRALLNAVPGANWNDARTYAAAQRERIAA